MNELVNHLWQSTVCGAVIGAACLLLRRNRARLRFWMWLAASLKFLLPFSLLVSLGDGLGRPKEAPLLTAVTVERMVRTFSPAPLLSTAGAPAAAPLTWAMLWPIAWAAGTAFLLGRWLLRWLRLHRTARSGRALPLDLPVPVVVTRSRIEPGLLGVLRPVLLLPEGLLEQLTPVQFRTIVAHELCHVRERDNLFAALHMFVQALFWFHPVVWWIGARMIAERERACDESVVEQGNAAAEYVAGILRVCQFCLQSPLPCVAGVTGSDLKKRVREILTQRAAQQLTMARKIMLAASAFALCTSPLLLGILRGQTLPPEPKYGYDVATIRPSAPGETMVHLGPGPQGGLRVRNGNILMLLRFAYNLQEFQFANIPEWVKTERYDMILTPDKPEAAMNPSMTAGEIDSLMDRHRQRMQTFLRDRLRLAIRAETKEQSMYALVIANGGHKLKPAAAPERGPNHNMSRGRVTGTSVPVDRIVYSMSQFLERHVVDETGLSGTYDFTFVWTPEAGAASSDAAEGSGPSLFTALQEQLGLRLVSRKGPVPVLVIEKIERPSEN